MVPPTYSCPVILSKNIHTALSADRRKNIAMNSLERSGCRRCFANINPAAANSTTANNIRKRYNISFIR